jgi:hypothetical protein
LVLDWFRSFFATFGTSSSLIRNIFLLGDFGYQRNQNEHHVSTWSPPSLNKMKVIMIYDAPSFATFAYQIESHKVSDEKITNKLSFSIFHYALPRCKESYLPYVILRNSFSAIGFLPTNFSKSL